MKLAVVLALVAAPTVLGSTLVQAQKKVVVGAEAAGRNMKATKDNCEGKNEEDCNSKSKCTFIIAGVKDNRFCVLTAGEDSVVRQGSDNAAPSRLGVVSGGADNLAGADGDYNVVSGGRYNYPNGEKGTVSGGARNTIEKSDYGTISGGDRNSILQAPAGYNAISGGKFNTAEGEYITISGGENNVASGKGTVIMGGKDGIARDGGVIMGGFKNRALGKGSVVVGGQQNQANGVNSIAMGVKAIAKNDNSMVINLGTKKLETEEDGQFLASATTYLFQIGNGLPTKQGNPQTVTFTAENVQLLNDLLDKED